MEEDAVGELIEQAAAVGITAVATVAAAVGVIDHRDRLRKERAAMECPECPGR